MSNGEKNVNQSPENKVSAVDGVIEVVRGPRKPGDPFIPMEPLVLIGNPARKLSPRDRARLLKIVNKTRTGKKHFTVEVTYDKQTDAPARIDPEDYQKPEAVSCKTHLGLVVNAKMSKAGDFFLTVLDSMRQNQGAQGFTSMRLSGIRKLRIITENDGPVPPKPL